MKESSRTTMALEGLQVHDRAAPGSPVEAVRWQEEPLPGVRWGQRAQVMCAPHTPQDPPGAREGLVCLPGGVKCFLV